MKYITYHIQGLGVKTPIAVDVFKLSREKQTDLYFDATSLVALKNVKNNFSGRLRKDIIIISSEEHYKYMFRELEKQYYDKVFNPEYF